MRLYLAGADSSGDHIALDGLNNLAFLVSYWYTLHGKGWDVIRYANERGLPVFLDSGAFSAMTIGAEIDIHEYINFCREHQKKFEVIASLDVIGDWKGTAQNHDRMKQAGIDSIPAFHVREPFDALEQLIKDNDYIALGVAGMQRRRNGLMAWLTKCFKIRERIKPLVKYHGFALTSDVVMRSFNWYSVDSSSWLIGGRHFAQIYVREGNRIFQISSRKNRALEKYMWQIRDVLVPRTTSKETYNPLIRHNANTILEWSRWIK